MSIFLWLLSGAILGFVFELKSNENFDFITRISCILTGPFMLCFLILSLDKDYKWNLV